MESMMSKNPSRSFLASRKELGKIKILGTLYLYLFGKKINLQQSSEAFLFRAMKAGKFKELPSELLAKGKHLFKLKEEFKKERKDLDLDEAEDHAKIEVEEHRIVANVIGLAGVISVNFSKGFATFSMVYYPLT